MSDGEGQDDNEEPQYYQAVKGQQVLKKITALYSQVSLKCVLKEPNELLPASKKLKNTVIPDSNHEIIVKLITDTCGYRKAAATVGV